MANISLNSVGPNIKSASLDNNSGIGDQNRRVEKQNVEENRSAEARKKAGKADDKKKAKSIQRRVEAEKSIKTRQERRSTDLVKENAANDTQVGKTIDMVV